MSASRRHPDPSLVATLDIGAAKANCLIARRGPNGSITPLGVGRQTMRRGADAAGVDFEAAVRLVAVAADEAMRMAGAPVPPVVAAFSSADLEGQVLTGAAPIPAQGLGPRVIEAARAAALRNFSHRHRRLLSLHVVSQRIDGEACADGDLLGRRGTAFSVDILAISAPEAAVAQLERLCMKAGLELAAVAPAPLAAAAAVIDGDHDGETMFVIDLGASQSGLVQFAQGAPVFATTHGVGGDLVTQALAQALETTNAAAERIKIAHGGVETGTDGRSVVEFARLNADGRLSAGAAARATICATARGAWLDLLAALRKVLDGRDASGLAPVTLVGGGAMTPGIAGLAERAWGRKVRIGAPRGFGAIDAADGGPGYAVACGLLRRGDAAGDAASGPRLRQSMHRAWDWLRENL